MIRKLHHPLWTHLPALVCIGVSAYLLATAHAPASVPVHFNAHGNADRFGSMVEHWIALVLLPLAFAIGSACLDEFFVRHESQRRFNWLALFDDAFAGFFLGLTLAVVPQLAAVKPVLGHFVPLGLALAGAAALAAAILERLRPFRPVQPPPPADVSDIQSALRQSLPTAHRWLYWETQNPAYLRMLIPIATLLMLFGAIVTFRPLPWALPLYLLGTALLVAAYGGLRTTLTRDRFTVRLGVFSIPLLRLSLSDITSAEPVDFNPLADFGGWGIRYSLKKKMWGYFLAGSRALQIQTTRGKRYLIGSDTPDRLAAVLLAAKSNVA